MSLVRLVYYNAVIGGWAAFAGWLISELTARRGGGSSLEAGLVSALVGGFIAGGLSLIGGRATNASWVEQGKRLAIGLAAGAVGGVIGGALGNVLAVEVGLSRWIGWALVGAGIGVAEGLSERSRDKVFKGLLGGTIGGIIGGAAFDPIRALLGSSTGLLSRAVGFVILGMCIGMLIGIVHVVLKEAWLSVLDGYRPGRQLILSQPRTVIGRAEWSTLPFLADGDRVLELEHLRIEHQPDGNYALVALGPTTINNVALARSVLRDGDVLRFGNNAVRFNERARKSGPAVETPSTPTIAPPAPTRAPVPVPAPAVVPPVPAVRARPPAARTAAPSPSTCPQCGKDAGKGQRYCMICDLEF